MITVIDGNPKYSTSVFNIEDSSDLDILLNSGEYDNCVNGSTAQYCDSSTGDLRVFYFNNNKWMEI